MAKERGGNNHPDRNGAILNYLRVQRNAKISELQNLLGVSDMTVRRCLNEMAAEGLLKRVHGGAAIVDPWERELAFQNRVVENLEVKMALAVKAETFIPDGGSVYLDGGTTCFEIAKQLSSGGKKCTVVTDSMAIVRELLGKQRIESILLGGRLSDDGNTLDGPVAQEAAAKTSVDVCMISCDGFNEKHLLNKSLVGSQTKKVMMDRAALTVCVTASNKFGCNRCFQFCDWESIEIFVTDSRLPPEPRQCIEGKGVEIHLAVVPPGPGLVNVTEG